MYIVIKTSNEKVKECSDSIYEAGRGKWYLNPKNAKNCSHAVITLRGSKEIKAVYRIESWENTYENRYSFNGIEEASPLIGKRLNSKFFKQGRRNPISYASSERELLETEL